MTNNNQNTAEDFNEHELFRNLMFHSENMVNFYVPVYENTEIVDFKLVYFNETGRMFLNKKKEHQLGGLLSKVYPFFFEKGGIDFLKEAVLSKTTQTRTHDYLLEGQKKSLKTTVQPTQMGILATTIDVSENSELQERLSLSNTNLERKILELEHARYFSQNVLDSSNNIITYFLPIFNENDKVVDFQIDYINERIAEAIGKPTDRIVGRRFSEFYPKGLENGDFDLMVDCYDNKEEIEVTKHFEISGSHYYFSSRMVRLDNGLVLFSKDITKERRFEEELALRNRMLNRAEKLSGVGSFRWNIDTGELTYSDNYFRILGFEPDEFQPSYEKFMSWVHPDDIPLLEDEVRTCMKFKSVLDTRFRLTLHNGNVKIVNAVGNIYEKNGKEMMVGSVKDITEEVEFQLKLEDKNLALERTNNELMSFNRVASHDLQEPLRKIQMFTSRIVDEDYANLSDRSKQFLDKITNSSERMRALIQNLLSYSKLGDDTETLDKVNLNMVLSNVLENFEERIRETDATVKSDVLPSVYGVDFQLEQLLSNLISNALKYKKDNVSPKIKIVSKIVKYSEVSKRLKLARSRYLILTISDNGIGFEEQYGEKIFGMFQRLHSKNEFTGTGLGLSICQKIVQSHRGHIEATGKPDNGAKFKIYLPYSA